MKLLLHTREKEEKEEKKKGSHDHNEREIEDNRDRLSDLPDCILIHMLSFLKAEDAVRTCILSLRWQHLWKHLPVITLNSSGFRTREGFMNFVNGILPLRDFSTALNALDFELKGKAEAHVIESIVRYAASQNVNRLRIFFDDPARVIRFPLSLFSCRSLTSLDIGLFIHIEFPNSLNLPVLTYLKLHNVFFYSENDGRVEPFSTFKLLTTLILYSCVVRNAKPLCISNTTLLNLSVHIPYIRPCRYRSSYIELFAPSLCAFAFSCISFQKLFGSHLSSIKQVSIDVYYMEESITILSWLKEMTNIKSLTVTPETLKALSLYPDICKRKLTSCCKLKSLKLSLNLDSYRYTFYRVGQRNVKMALAGGKSWKENSKLRELIEVGLGPKYSSILDGMIDFLLQNSPSAKVEVLLESKIKIY